MHICTDDILLYDDKVRNRDEAQKACTKCVYIMIKFKDIILPCKIRSDSQ